ncbi:hypothetical protein [Candidatus Phycosocius spiralis]|uniref:Uncharacterized protein n=1 Tax=Candidatus Phycosocius spiralis TaxID=2815099 RepID=A0ABQ4PVN6_9PROT|nr:hypothetical protein [Candidatus Phycosocius spiralis]GIU67097.1 hypothetical protein PsB1_1251 [Candidatus Phycosocius spiralis]
MRALTVEELEFVSGGEGGGYHTVIVTGYQSGGSGFGGYGSESMGGDKDLDPFLPIDFWQSLSENGAYLLMQLEVASKQRNTNDLYVVNTRGSIIHTWTDNKDGSKWTAIDDKTNGPGFDTLRVSDSLGLITKEFNPRSGLYVIIETKVPVIVQ